MFEELYIIFLGMDFKDFRNTYMEIIIRLILKIRKMIVKIWVLDVNCLGFCFGFVIY